MTWFYPTTGTVNTTIAIHGSFSESRRTQYMCKFVNYFNESLQYSVYAFFNSSSCISCVVPSLNFSTYYQLFVSDDLGYHWSLSPSTFHYTPHSPNLQIPYVNTPVVYDFYKSSSTITGLFLFYLFLFFIFYFIYIYLFLFFYFIYFLFYLFFLFYYFFILFLSYFLNMNIGYYFTSSTQCKLVRSNEYSPYYFSPNFTVTQIAQTEIKVYLEYNNFTSQSNYQIACSNDGINYSPPRNITFAPIIYYTSPSSITPGEIVSISGKGFSKANFQRPVCSLAYGGSQQLVSLIVHSFTYAVMVAPLNINYNGLFTFIFSFFIFFFYFFYFFNF